ncbi:hypothetical protein JHK85_049172 [Glycine max]|nr:hypothetical protein JHK85_049172 [Glycine max]KHN36968.1 hypothetical protein glysoja_008996 [Glycine soja]
MPFTRINSDTLTPHLGVTFYKNKTGAVKLKGFQDKPGSRSSTVDLRSEHN